MCVWPVRSGGFSKSALRFAALVSCLFLVISDCVHFFSELLSNHHYIQRSSNAIDLMMTVIRAIMLTAVCNKLTDMAYWISIGYANQKGT